MAHNRGGIREGAGRKPSGKSKVQFWIDPIETEFLRKMLNEHREGINLFEDAKNLLSITELGKRNTTSSENNPLFTSPDELTKQELHYEDEIATLKMDFENEIANLKAEHSEEIREHTQKIRKLQKKYDDDVEKLEQSEIALQNELEDLKLDMERNQQPCSRCEDGHYLVKIKNGSPYVVCSNCHHKPVTLLF